MVRTARDYFWLEVNESSARAIAREIPGYAFFLGLFIAAHLVLALYGGEIPPADHVTIATYLICAAYFGAICWYSKTRLWALFAFPAGVVTVGAGYLLHDHFHGVALTSDLVIAVIFAPLIISQFRVWLWLVRFGAPGGGAPAGEA